MTKKAKIKKVQKKTLDKLTKEAADYFAQKEKKKEKSSFKPPNKRSTVPKLGKCDSCV